MDNFVPLIIIAAIGLLVITTSTSVNSVLAATKVLPLPSSARAGPVVQEQVDTGNPTLDKAISKFYSCISKTHQDPPTVQIVDNCYSQNAIAGTSGPGSNTHNISTIKTHPTSGGSPRIASSPPPGILVEVP